MYIITHIAHTVTAESAVYIYFINNLFVVYIRSIGTYNITVSTTQPFVT